MGSLPERSRGHPPQPPRMAELSDGIHDRDERRHRARDLGERRHHGRGEQRHHDLGERRHHGGGMALGSDGTEPAAIVLVDVRLVDLGVDGLRASAHGWDPGSEPRSALGQKGWARGPADHAPRERSERKGACTWRRSAHRLGGEGARWNARRGRPPGRRSGRARSGRGLRDVSATCVARDRLRARGARAARRERMWGAVVGVGWMWGWGGGAGGGGGRGGGEAERAVRGLTRARTAVAWGCDRGSRVRCALGEKG